MKNDVLERYGVKKQMKNSRSPAKQGKKPSSAWGKHLILDIYGVERKKLEDWRAIKKLLSDLPLKLKMRAIRKPVVIKLASEKYPDWGISGFVMLYESHISCHTWPEANYVAIDVYSCKDFDEKTVVQYLKNHWRCGKMKTKMVIRG